MERSLTTSRFTLAQFMDYHMKLLKLLDSVNWDLSLSNINRYFGLLIELFFFFIFHFKTSTLLLTKKIVAIEIQNLIINLN